MIFSAVSLGAPAPFAARASAARPPPICHLHLA